MEKEKNSMNVGNKMKQDMTDKERHERGLSWRGVHDTSKENMTVCLFPPVHLHQITKKIGFSQFY